MKRILLGSFLVVLLVSGWKWLAVDKIKIGGDYAKNSLGMYYFGYGDGTIEPCHFTPLNVDGKTFEVIEPFTVIAKDKKRVYLSGKVVPLDPDSLRVVADPFSYSGHWLIDKNFVYYGETLTGADAKSFELIDYGWAKDKDRLYSGKNSISADTASFKPINKYYGMDKK